MMFQGVMEMTSATTVGKKITKMIRVVLKKSTISCKKNHRLCVQGLGLKRIRHAVLVEDNPCNRGMINKARYLLDVDYNYES
jgi:large subunit ribosomal protein L30